MEEEQNNKVKRGFGTMIETDPDRHREISGMGGAKAHQLRVAHRFTKEEAAAAGRIGGRARKKKKAKPEE